MEIQSVTYLTTLTPNYIEWAHNKYFRVPVYVSDLYHLTSLNANQRWVQAKKFGPWSGQVKANFSIFYISVKLLSWVSPLFSVGQVRGKARPGFNGQGFALA